MRDTRFSLTWSDYVFSSAALGLALVSGTMTALVGRAPHLLSLTHQIELLSAIVAGVGAVMLVARHEVESLVRRTCPALAIALGDGVLLEIAPRNLSVETQVPAWTPRPARRTHPVPLEPAAKPLPSATRLSA